ncbi:MAG: universal stress protein [Bernardetiaceae bacterium]
METILFATDLSDQSLSAAAAAVSLARYHQSRLVVYHPFTMLQPAGGNQYMYRKRLDELQQEAQQKLHALIPPKATDHEVVYHISHEAHARVWDRLLRDYDFSLIVVPNHVVDGFLDIKLLQIIKDLPCPLLKVPQKSQEEQEEVSEVSFGQIVYATDLVRPTEGILPFLEGFIEQFDSQIACLHIQSEKNKKTPPQEEMKNLQAFLSDTLERDIQTTILECADVVKGIEDYLSQQPTDLLIMQTRTHTFLERAFQYRPTAQKVAQSVDVPILVIKDN